MTIRLEQLLARGQRAFATSRFFEAQVAWEAAARDAEGQRRGWIQALSTLAAGMLAVEEHRLATAERLLARGIAGLVQAPIALEAADVEAARASADAYLVALRGEVEPLWAWLEPAALPTGAREVERRVG